MGIYCYHARPEMLWLNRFHDSLCHSFCIANPPRCITLLPGSFFTILASEIKRHFPFKYQNLKTHSVFRYVKLPHTEAPRFVTLSFYIQYTGWYSLDWTFHILVVGVVYLYLFYHHRQIGSIALVVVCYRRLHLYRHILSVYYCCPRKNNHSKNTGAHLIYLLPKIYIDVNTWGPYRQTVTF